MKDNVHTMILFPTKVPKTKHQKKEQLAEGEKLKTIFQNVMAKILEDLEKLGSEQDPESVEKRKAFLNHMKSFYVEAAEKYNEKAVWWEINEHAFKNIFEKKHVEKHILRQN